MKSLLFFALGLMLLLEGIIPFLFPRQWRDTINRIAQLTDGQIRFVGLLVLLCGLATLSLVHIFS
ncbi:DUF2065 domain-containing protein [Noviherbaspirillum sp. ST9]|uniref:DUF2065 domain-containing protein n=1 Tax=Noviherbaspirillum sp. ST9 TaxID=3401606 RepID=UPI003B587E62